MDSYTGTVDSKQLSAEQADRLLQLSRVDSALGESSFRKIRQWFLRVAGGCVQDKALATVVANVLLHSGELRTAASRDAEFVRAVELRLYENCYDLPRWRIMFLLAHCKPQGCERASEYEQQPFDRRLAPASFQKMVSALDSDPQQMAVLTELGKYWYALCFNYRYSVPNSMIYWTLFTELSRKPYSSVDGFQECLIQFGSLYLLLHSEDMVVERTTVNRFLCIFEDKFNDWFVQASRELYCPLQEHRLPQILKVLQLLISYSSPQLKQDIVQCFLSPQNPFHCPFVNSSFIKLIESPISNVSDITTSILQLLHLTHNKDTHKIELLPPASRESSVSSARSRDYVTYSGLQTPYSVSAADEIQSISGATSLTASTSAADADTWSEEDQIQEAEKIGAAIQRLNELGFVKMSTSTSTK